MKTISTFKQLCFAIAMTLVVQSNAQNFQQVFEGAATFEGYMAAASASNPANTMVAGNHTDANGNTDIHFMELDPAGNVVSETKYGTPQTEKILWMESVAGDGYYFGGYTSDGSITEAIVGKLQLDNFVFVKKLDSGNPEVAKVCCTGKHYPAAMFTCRAAGDGQLELMQISPDLNTIIFSKDVRSASGATDLDVVTHIEEIQGVGYLLSGGANQAPGGLLASAVMLDYNLNILWSKRYGLNIGINNRCIATSATFDPVHGHILQLVNMEQGPEMAIRTYDLAGNVVAGKTVSIAMPGSGDVEGFRIFYRPQFTDILITGYQRNGTYTGDYDGDGIADIITGRMPVRIQLDANTLAVISCTRDIPSNPLIEPTYGAAATGYPRVHYPESVSYDLSLDISRNGNASLTPSGVSQLRVSTFDSAGNPACATDAPVCSTAPLTLPNFGSLSLLATSPTVIPVTMGIEPVASVSVSVCGETPPSICEGLTVDIVLVAELAGSVSLAVNGRDENGNMIPTESISFGNVSLGDGTLPFDLPPGISSLDHHYDANGEYLVCIDATCVSGETATGCLSVDICVAPAQTFLTRNGHWVNFDPFTVTVEILWGDEEEGELAEICDDGSAEHTYSQPGTYEICYYPECDDQMLVCETIEINCADFIQPFTWTYDDLIGEVNFYSPSSLPFEIYYWTFGDAQTSSEQNPAHIFESEGTYPVCFTATCSDGNTAEICVDVEADNVDLQCTLPTDVVAVTDDLLATLTVFGPGSDPFEGRFLINWGDGEIQLAISSPFGDDFPIMFSHIYNTPGLVDVTVESTCFLYPNESVIFVRGIEPINEGCQPISQLVFETKEKATVTIEIVDTQTPPVSVEVNWGDGTIEPWSEPSIEHTYESEGYYVICVSGTCLDGYITNHCEPVTVTCGDLLPSLLWQLGDEPGEINFFGPGSEPFVPKPWELLNFGDGSPVLIEPPFVDGIISHIFPGPGSYNVCVAETCDDGNYDSECVEVILTCDAFAHQFTWQGGDEPGEINFFDPGSEPFDGLLAISSPFGDDFPIMFNADGIGWTHVFTEPGTVDVCLTTTCSDGSTSQWCSAVEVTNVCPAIPLSPFLFSADELVVLGYWFENLISDEYFKFSVNWGDGNPTEEMTSNFVSHLMEEEGMYYVCGYVECLATGVVEEFCQSMTVAEEPCPCCEVSGQNISAGGDANTVTVQTTNATSYIVTEIDWGDGTTGGYQGNNSLSHTYAACGTYTVKVVKRCVDNPDVIISEEEFTVTISDEDADGICNPDDATCNVPVFDVTTAGCGIIFGPSFIADIPGDYSIHVDWGDSSQPDEWSEGELLHSFAQSGTYTVTATPSCTYSLEVVPQVWLLTIGETCDDNNTIGGDGCSTLMFEDQWPMAGDLDFNDCVVRYNFIDIDDDGDFSPTMIFNWGDGSTEQCDDGDSSHEYSDAGNYPVIITSLCSTGTYSTIEINASIPETCDDSNSSTSDGIALVTTGCEVQLSVNIVDFIDEDDYPTQMNFIVNWGDGNSSESLVTITDVNQDGLPEIITAVYLDQDDDNDGISFEIISDADQNDVVVRYNHTYHDDGQLICTVMRADIDGEGVVSILDLAAVATEFLQGCATEECDDLAYVEPIPGNDCGIMLSWWDCDKPLTSRMVSWGDGTSEICNDGCTHQYGGTDTGAYEVIANAFYVDGTYATEIISVSIAETCDDGNSCTLPTSISITQDTEDPTRFYYWPGEIPLATGEDGLPIPPPCSLNPDIVYDWDFGDGTTSSDCIAEHQYSTCGDFPVSLNVQFLTVEECEFFAAQFSTQLTVACPPVLQMNVVMDGCDAGVAFIIDGTGTWDIEADAIVSFHVNYGDGTTPINTIHSVHHYDQPGTYTITGTAVDNDNTEIVFTEVVVADCDVPCVGDLDNNGVINVIDLLQLMGVFGESCDDGLSE